MHKKIDEDIILAYLFLFFQIKNLCVLSSRIYQCPNKFESLKNVKPTTLTFYQLNQRS